VEKKVSFSSKKEGRKGGWKEGWKEGSIWVVLWQTRIER